MASINIKVEDLKNIFPKNEYDALKRIARKKNIKTIYPFYRLNDDLKNKMLFFCYFISVLGLESEMNLYEKAYVFAQRYISDKRYKDCVKVWELENVHKKEIDFAKTAHVKMYVDNSYSLSHMFEYLIKVKESELKDMSPSEKKELLQVKDSYYKVGIKDATVVFNKAKNQICVTIRDGVELDAIKLVKEAWDKECYGDSKQAFSAEKWTYLDRNNSECKEHHSGYSVYAVKIANYIEYQYNDKDAIYENNLEKELKRLKNPSNWKKVKEKAFNIYIARPEIGTRFFNVIERKEYVTTKEKPFVIARARDEYWTASSSEILENCCHTNGDVLSLDAVPNSGIKDWEILQWNNISNDDFFTITVSKKLKNYDLCLDKNQTLRVNQCDNFGRRQDALICPATYRKPTKKELKENPKLTQIAIPDFTNIAKFSTKVSYRMFGSGKQLNKINKLSKPDFEIISQNKEQKKNKTSKEKVA